MYFFFIKRKIKKRYMNLHVFPVTWHVGNHLDQDEIRAPVAKRTHLIETRLKQQKHCLHL